jgi:hypothetical protein
MTQPGKFFGEFLELFAEALIIPTWLATARVLL